MAEAKEKYERLHAIFKEKMNDPNCSKEEANAAWKRSMSVSSVVDDYMATIERIKDCRKLEKEVYDKRHAPDQL